MAAENDIEILIPPTLDAARLEPDPNGHLLHLKGDTMGTSWTATLVIGESGDPSSLQPAIEDGFREIIRQMSQWERDSELSRFNRAPAGEWIEISPQFVTVLSMALIIAKASDGVFDPAIGHLTDLWGFGADSRISAWPDRENIRSRQRFNWRDISLDRDNRRLFQPGGLAIDLAAIAKGFAVDHTIAVLEAHSIKHALVEIGGELRAIGVKPDGQPWWVDIDTVGDHLPSRIALSGWSVATSGNNLRRRSFGDKSWSHSISPSTGQPLAESVSAVTVLHPGCMQADALATAIMVKGIDEGLRFADRHRIAAQIVAEGEVYASPKWTEYCEG